MTEFVTTLVLQFKKIESDDKTKSETFYSNSIILCYNYIKHTKVFRKRFCWIIDSIIDYNINISKYNPLPLAIAIRNSYHRCSTKIGVLKNFAKLAGKHLCQSLFLNKVSGLTQLKKRLRYRCFPVNFAKFKNIDFTEHLWTTITKRIRPSKKRFD